MAQFRRSSYLLPEDHVVAVDDFGEVAVGGEVVGALAADGGELEGGVVGEAAANGGAGGGHERYQVAGVERALDGGDADGEQAAALVEERAAGAGVEHERAHAAEPGRHPALATGNRPPGRRGTNALRR